ncbi:MAG TPA: hypothetical protein VIL32_13815, partial [Steroidobacteraceae bacterium]
YIQTRKAGKTCAKNFLGSLTAALPATQRCQPDAQKYAPLAISLRSSRHFRTRACHAPMLLHARRTPAQLSRRTDKTMPYQLISGSKFDAVAPLRKAVRRLRSAFAKNCFKDLPNQQPRRGRV